MINEELKNLPIVESDVRTVDFMDRLSDLIGDRYKEWDIGELIFIHASTGLGKSYAAMNDWYEHLMTRKEETAFLVNRRLLRDQMTEELRRHELEMNRRKVHLHLFTYQQLEGNGDEVARRKDILRRCRFVICDECHYFRADATFNSGVQKSFDFITSLYEHTTLVFMSATMSHIRPLIEKRIISLHLDKAEYWRTYKRNYESDYMEAAGYEDCLADIVESRTELEDDPDYIFEMSELEKAIAPPRVKEYQFLRNLSKNLKVMRFGTVDELIDVIENDYYPGKWLIFVSSKSIGKRIRDGLLENDQKQRNVVYVDAEYDELSDTEDEVRQQALKEVTYITREKKFQCDILITTAVLDNGVNIMDDRVKNIVLMTDDEDEFMQMLGRRRFTNKQEVVNLFISNGNVGTFKKRMRRYFETFWELCEKPEISVLAAQEMLLSDPIQMVHNLSTYYRLNGFKYSCNELALETIRTKYMFCNDVLTGLENDENYFLQVQLGWLGMDFTSEWRDNSNVSVSNDETNGITELLESLYCSGGIMGKKEFEEFAQQLINVAAKIDPTSFRGKSGSIKTVNSALKLRKEWQGYQIKTGGDDTTFYEMFLEGKPHNCIPEGMTPQKLRQIVDEVDTDDFCLIFQRLFETEVPMCLKKDAKGLQVFINQKLISYPGMENVILKSMGRAGEKKIRISRKPQRKNDN